MNFSDLPDNETLRLARQLSENRSALNATQQFILDRSPTTSALEQMAVRAFEEIRRRQDSFAYKQVLDVFSGAGSALRTVTPQLLLSDAQRATMEALKGLGSTALSQTAREASAVLLFQQQHLLRNAMMEAVRSLRQPDNATLQAFGTDAFANTLIEHLRRSAETSAATEEAIKKLHELIDKKVAELPRGRVSMEALLSIIVAVVLFLANIAYLEIKEAQKTEAPIFTDTQIERVAQAIETTERLKPQDDESAYYVVERRILIRVKPNNRSAPVAFLYPNQTVRLEKLNHQWIYVEYFDYIEGIPKLGWVNKKYLKKLT
ncbi:MAG: hypothetical protein QOK48_2114 [Blastocatellia bacterium]|nr:hypothetical protein [Blastocatellia bacterium]